MRLKIPSKLTQSLLLVACALLAACATSPPQNPHNICDIFSEHRSWYKSAKKSSEKWGGPIHVPLAIMYQESAFKAKAKPPMQYFLWVIPKGRASDAYGYSQALESTWAAYQKSVGSSFKSRDNFGDAFDFIQWYMHQSYVRNGVSKWDATGQYLNYHEGQGGFSRGTHRNKKWLLDVAKRVEHRSAKYAKQLSKCKAQLDKKRGWF